MNDIRSYAHEAYCKVCTAFKWEDEDTGRDSIDAIETAIQKYNQDLILQYEELKHQTRNLITCTKSLIEQTDTAIERNDNPSRIEVSRLQDFRNSCVECIRIIEEEINE